MRLGTTGKETPSLGHCRLCGSDSLVPRMNVRGWTISDCPRCGLKQVAGNPSSTDLDAIYTPSYFEKGKYRDDEAGRREQARRLAKMLEAGLQRGSRVLDLGMATGEFVSAARSTFEMWGIDVAESAVEIARSAMPDLSERMVVGRLDSLSFPPGHFDAVVMWDVLEHLPDPRATLTSAARMTRTGGFLFISTPNAAAPIARLMLSRWHFMTPPEHLTFFDRDTLENLLRRCGYQPSRWASHGKWANLGFLAHKLHRVMPEIMPASLQRRIAGSRMGKSCIYVPTGDIQYLTATRTEEALG